MKQIAGLRRLPVRDLKQCWRDLFGTESPAYNRTFLIRRLAYRLQELAYGGLLPPTGPDSSLWRILPIVIAG